MASSPRGKSEAHWVPWLHRKAHGVTIVNPQRSWITETLWDSTLVTQRFNQVRLNDYHLVKNQFHLCLGNDLTDYLMLPLIFWSSHCVYTGYQRWTFHVELPLASRRWSGCLAQQDVESVPNEPTAALGVATADGCERSRYHHILAERLSMTMIISRMKEYLSVCLSVCLYIYISLHQQWYICLGEKKRTLVKTVKTVCSSPYLPMAAVIGVIEITGCD